jgi:glycerol-3-phosphate dehydrogenase
MLQADRLAGLRNTWDIIVVGGGMTGAGVFREASRAGYRTLLVEQRDFAWGTSSRSGKLVHGGLRYLGQGQVRTTWHSVREREGLLRSYPGLVRELSFTVPVYNNLTKWMLAAGLTTYDSMAFHWSHRYWPKEEFLKQVPEVNREKLQGGFTFRDAMTDDARLVFRVIREGEDFGGKALNYMLVEELLRDSKGRVKGVSVKDALNGKTEELFASAVVNATGVWADKLREAFGERPRLRKLRGSHLVLPFERLPLRQAVSFSHPADHRPLYAMPWLGKILVGTTDIDHESSLMDEPEMDQQEGQYLLTGLNYSFPDCHIEAGDLISTFAGVRPVLNTGKRDPSKESRDLVIWSQEGLVTVTGGKLTTFPLLARKALRETLKWLDGVQSAGRLADAGEKETAAGGFDRKVGFKLETGDCSKGADVWQKFLLDRKINQEEGARLKSRYGEGLGNLAFQSEELWKSVPGSDMFWAELVWSAKEEQVAHLEDLLLRRTRLGLLLPGGGAQILKEVQKRLSPVLDWDELRWEKETSGYLGLWQQAYSPQRLKT